MGWLNIVLALYALLDIGMGWLGYMNKGSVISLVAGVTAGVVVLGSIAWTKFNPRAGRITALIITMLMLGQFGPKMIALNQFYPAGIMSAASLGVAFCLLAGHVMGVRAKKARAAEKKQHAND